MGWCVHSWSTVSCTFVYTVKPSTSRYRAAGFLSKDKNWQHEDASEMMFDDMVEQYKLDSDIPPKDVQFIKALITGDGTRCRSAFIYSFLAPPYLSQCSDEKSFLFEIVANKRNGIDVDK